MRGSGSSKTPRQSKRTRRAPSRTDFARVRAAQDFVWDGVSVDDSPASLKELRAAKLRGPQKAPTKMLMSMRFSREVIEHFRSTGPGWQARIDQVLRAHMGRRVVQARSKP
jgi:uncharacterized protein (DUF4415 family)